MTKKKIARSKRGTKQRDGAAAKAEKPIPFVPADQPVDADIKRAAKRAGIVSTEIRAQDRIVNLIAPYLVLATELASEGLAWVDNTDESRLADLLSELNHTVWRARWELGVLTDDVRYEAPKGSDGQADDRTAGGAS